MQAAGAREERQLFADCAARGVDDVVGEGAACGSRAAPVAPSCRRFVDAPSRNSEGAAHSPESLVSSVGGEVLTDLPKNRAGTLRVPPVAPESPVSSPRGVTC